MDRQYLAFFIQIGDLVRNGFLVRLAILFFGGSFLLCARWRIMGTGPPSFTEVDNPASFAENVILRVCRLLGLGFSAVFFLVKPYYFHTLLIFADTYFFL